MRQASFRFGVFLWLLTGCGAGPRPVPDGGLDGAAPGTDSGSAMLDSGSSDAGSLDAGSSDAGGPAGCTTTEECADPVHQSCDTVTGACEPSDLGSDTRATYGDGVERRYVGCYFCDAILNADGSALLRYQQGDGLSIWTLYLPPGVATGSSTLLGYPEYISSGLHAHISENGGDVPSAYRGSYDQSGGTLTLTRAELRSGGVVEGTLDAPIEVRSASPAKTGRLRVTFFARFP